MTCHFRVNTCELLDEIVQCSLPQNSGVLKVPLNVFKNLLAQLAERATQLNDPIMNKIMFDLTLYELPEPTTKEYGKMMQRVYAAAKKQAKKEKNGR